MKSSIVRTVAVAGAVALALILGPAGAGAALSDTTLYDFTTDYQGWILQIVERTHDQSGATELLDYQPFPEAWEDATQYPYPPGSDPLGDSEGAFAVGLHLEGIWDNQDPVRRWFDAVLVQSEDYYTHYQATPPAGYELHPDYTGTWPYGHYASLGEVAGDSLRLRVYLPAFSHPYDPVTAWVYTKSGAWIWQDGGELSLEHGWNILSYPVDRIEDPTDVLEIGVKVGANHPLGGMLRVDQVTLDEVTLPGGRFVFMSPDTAWISDVADYDARQVTIYYDDGGAVSPGVRGFSVDLTYPSALVTVASVTEGTLLAAHTTVFEYDDDTPGTLTIDGAILGATTGAGGSGSLATITFSAAPGAGDDCGALHFTDQCKLRDPDNQALSGTWLDGAVAHDITPPATPVLASPTHAEATTRSSDDLQITWNAVADGGTCPVGMRAYYLLLDETGGSEVPSSTNYTWFTPAMVDSAAYSHWFEDLDDGTYHVHVIAYDWLWNASAIDTYGPIQIDTTPPANVTDLQAGTTADGNRSVDLSWTNPGADFAGVEIWACGYGNYPEYDDPPNPGATPSWPTSPADAQTAGWLQVYDGSATAEVDEPASRDYVYYAAFAYDAASPPNYAAAGAGAQAEALCYWLGDFDDLTGTGAVDFTDVLTLSLCYNTGDGDLDYNNVCDIGPTVDYGRMSLPTTDDEIEFEDLMVFSMNYASTTRGGATRPAEQPATVTARLRLEPAGEDWVAWIELGGNPGELAGASVELRYGAGLQVAEALAGAIWDAGPSLFLPADDGAGRVCLDAAMLAATTPHNGVHARVRFQRCGASAEPPEVSLVAWRARGPANQNLACPTGGQDVPGGQRPVRTALLAITPNPTAGPARLDYALAAPSAVRVCLFDAAGRLVRRLAEPTQGVGSHALLWDGCDREGRLVSPGIYFCRWQAATEVTQRRVIVIR